MAPKVKICGVRTINAAQTVEACAGDFIGLNFVPSSKRFVSIEQAKNIIDALPVERKVKIVGVFKDQSLSAIQTVLNQIPLDFVQLHGQEDPEFCSQISLPVIKAFALPANFDIETLKQKMAQYKMAIYLVDRQVLGQGQSLNTGRVKQLTNEFPIMLAGGLSPENIAEILAQVNPYAVDAAGGVETHGQQNEQKIIQFIQKAKGKLG